MSHLFISYSSVDGLDFAFRLHDALEAPPDNLSAWLDKRDLKSADNWDTQLRDAIRDSRAMLFAMTPDSVEDGSVCYDEWTLALSYKKHLVPLLIVPGTELPFRLHQRQYIDFTSNFDAAMAQLRQHLRELDSPAGELRRLQDQLADAKRRYRRVRDDSEARRIQDEIDRLTNEDIPRQKKLVDDPAAAAARTERSIAAGLERERQPERPIHVTSRTKFINPPPATAPGYFQDRVIETGEVGRFLADDALRLITVVGRGGAGKTALVCRLLKALENGHLPDDGGAFPVDGIVYLSALGARRLEFPTLFEDLSKLLPEDASKKLETVYKNPTGTPDAKIRALLAEFTPERFQHGRVVLLLDNFEDVTDAESRTISNEELAEALKALLSAPPHPVRVIITTRVALADLPTIQPGRQRRLDLDAGLESPYAETLLRELDSNGALGLRALSVDAPVLVDARERTRGIPRALEALYGILAADTSTSLDEVLSGVGKDAAPEAVTDALVGEAFSRLDITAQRVMGALAIYGRPVSPVAVDTLLQAYIPGIDSALVLARLVNMHFARKESGRFYLHPLDRAYALTRIPRGTPEDREFDSTSPSLKRWLAGEVPPFTQLALFHRAADYFASTRKPREEWKTLADLQPQLDEFDLRCEGGDWDAAASILLEIGWNYLLLWGHLRLVANLHERLQGKLIDPVLIMSTANSLGSAYGHMGYGDKAIPHYEVALRVAHVGGNQWAEKAFLTNLGVAYTVLGQRVRAIEYYQQALKICREIGDHQNAGTILGNLALTFSELGQITQAIEYYEQALAINREIGDRRGEGTNLGNLGLCYKDLGKPAQAIEYYEQGLQISREVGDRIVEGYRLAHLGDAYRDLGQTTQAFDYFKQALIISQQVGDRYIEGQILGAMGRMLIEDKQYSESLLYIHQSIRVLDEVDNPAWNGYANGMLALAHLRWNDTPKSRSAFLEAVHYADEALSRSAQGYEALDNKAFALAGLAICEDDPTYAAQAIEAYRTARAITSAAGVVASALRLFDLLAAADTQGVLAGVREAIAGTDSGEASS